MADNKREWLSRTELLLGASAVDKLASSRVAVFGVGGVGGFVVEGLARSGVGALDLIDCDKVSLSNINRQIIATLDTVGVEKTEAARARVMSINPECKVVVHNVFYLPETADSFDFSEYDYVVDAIDTVSGKMAIIKRAREAGIPVISSMGAGNKLDPTAFRVADIYETSVCPLAKVIRKECRKQGIDKLKVVYSTEQAIRPEGTAADTDSDAPSVIQKKNPPGSVAFVPSVAGLIIAGEVIKDLIKEE